MRIQEKYDLLPPEAQQHIVGIIDLFLKSQKTVVPTSSENWKANLEKVSVWDEEELSVFEETRKHLNTWTIPEW